jgi:polysaccharide biosynthesis/export protein
VRANRFPVAALSALLVAACSGGSATRYRSGPAPATPPTASPSAAPCVVSSAAHPAPPVQFRFDVGDELAMSVWKEPDLASQQRLLADGTISPPLLKPTRILGMSVEEVQAKLTEAYKEYLKEPKVSVRVVNIYSDRVFVLGEVKTPQAVSLVGPTTVVQAVAIAGGFNEETAKKGNVLVIRMGPDGQPAAESIDVSAVLCGGMADGSLHRGDIVYVPATGIANWSRVVGQALSPFATAIGAASSVAALLVAMKN